MSHTTWTPLSRSKGQLAGCGGILWWPPTQLVRLVNVLLRGLVINICSLNLCHYTCQCPSSELVKQQVIHIVLLITCNAFVLQLCSLVQNFVNEIVYNKIVTLLPENGGVYTWSGNISAQFEVSSCFQFFDTVGWVMGRASGL